MMQQGRLLVVGAGAIGSAFAGFLARAGEPVVLYGRGAHFQAVRARGLGLEGIWGEHPGIPVPTLAEGEAWSGPDPEAVLLAVKAYDTATAAEEAARLVGPETLWVSLQNGLGNCEILAERFTPERVVGGRVIFGARVPEPGRTAITVCAAPVMLGPLTTAAPDPLVERVLALAGRIERAGIPCRPTDRIASYLWAKALYNCALNPLSALLRCPYGRLAEQAETRDLMRRVVEEIYRVAGAESVSMLHADADAYFRYFLEEELPPTAAHHSSMLQAVLAGKRTEIEALSGEIVRRAARHGLSAPVNALLADLVRALECMERRGA